MNVVTVMNYDWSNFQLVCLGYTWIQQAKQWLTSKDHCIIFTSQPLPSLLQNTLEQSTTCSFSVCVRPGFHEDIYVPQCYNTKQFNSKNIAYKLYVLCQLEFPFVFLDADAFLVGELSELESLLNADRPVFFVEHEQAIVDEFKLTSNFINSGCIVATKAQREFLDWHKLYKFGKQRNFVFRFAEDSRIIPGSDQALLAAYARHTQYEYRHAILDNRYNCGARYADTPVKDAQGRWTCMVQDTPVKVLHYWYEKPWIADCPIYKDYTNALLRRAFSVESPR